MEPRTRILHNPNICVESGEVSIFLCGRSTWSLRSEFLICHQCITKALLDAPGVTSRMTNRLTHRLGPAICDLHSFELHWLEPGSHPLPPIPPCRGGSYFLGAELALAQAPCSIQGHPVWLWQPPWGKPPGGGCSLPGARKCVREIEFSLSCTLTLLC